MCKIFLDMVVFTCFYHDINNTLKYCPTLFLWQIILSLEIYPLLAAKIDFHLSEMSYIEVDHNLLVCHIRKVFPLVDL